MREILFRGKRTDNLAWETGSLVVIWPGTSMETVFITDKITGYQTKVDPSTVGQFTGLTDKNGKRIFEGDVVVIEADCIPSFMLNRYVVVWDDDQAAYKLLKDNTIYDLPMGRMEIIGNIHDNPELLEEESDDG